MMNAIADCRIDCEVDDKFLTLSLFSYLQLSHSDSQSSSVYDGHHSTS
jgi:hypothetical protein